MAKGWGHLDTLDTLDKSSSQVGQLKILSWHSIIHNLKLENVCGIFQVMATEAKDSETLFYSSLVNHGVVYSWWQITKS